MVLGLGCLAACSRSDLIVFLETGAQLSSFVVLRTGVWFHNQGSVRIANGVIFSNCVVPVAHLVAEFVIQLQ